MLKPAPSPLLPRECGEEKPRPPLNALPPAAVPRRSAEPPPPTAPGLGFPGPSRAAEPGRAPHSSALRGVTAAYNQPKRFGNLNKVVGGAS